jgi:hypothetical protein
MPFKSRYDEMMELYRNEEPTPWSTLRGIRGTLYGTSNPLPHRSGGTMQALDMMLIR